MTSTVARGREIALELYAFLRELDALRWKAGRIAPALPRFETFRAQIDEYLLQLAPVPATANLRHHFVDLSQVLSAPPSSPTFRSRLLAAYANLAHALKELDLEVPELRPRNHHRMLFHAGAGVATLILIEHVLTPLGLILMPTAFASVAWSLEILRRRRPGANVVLMKFFRRIAHAHESHRVNSSTWYMTALVILALTTSPAASAVGVIVLALADPAAAIIGRRFGRTRLVHGRTLEGSITFVVIGTLSAAAVLGGYHGVELSTALGIAAAAATAGALAELGSWRLDDNLVIPLVAAFMTSLWL